MKGSQVFDLIIDGKSLSDGHGEYLVINEDPEALLLADLVSIASDLQGALTACTMFIEETRAVSPDTKRLRIFLESAIISYARPFASGKGSGGKRARRKIDNLLQMLEPKQLEAHINAVQIRNQHVGHRVDPRVQSAVVLAAFDRVTLEFKDVSPFLSDQIDASIIKELAPSVEALVVLVEEEIAKECAGLTEEYKNQMKSGRFQLPAALASFRV